MYDISKAHKKHGKPGFHTALSDCFHAGIVCRKFIDSFLKNSHPHHLYYIPLLFIASFMASVCSFAFSWVTLLLRIALPIFSTGLQQLFIADTKGWSCLLYASQKTILKIVPDLICGMQLKKIFTTLIGGNQCGGPPYLETKPLFIENFLPFSGPGFLSAKDQMCIRDSARPL